MQGAMMDYPLTVQAILQRARRVFPEKEIISRLEDGSLHRTSWGELYGRVLRLMDALGIDTAHVVGHSTGGAIGQAIATDHPERLRSLVLSATWAGPDPFFRRVFESRRQVLLDSGVEAYLRASVLFQATPRWVSDNDEFITDIHRVTAASSAPVEVLVSRIDAILRHDRRRRLLEMRVPALVIVAQDDMITPRFYSEELAARIPGAKLVVLETGGHFAPAIHSEPYNAAVLQFLGSI